MCSSLRSMLVLVGLAAVAAGAALTYKISRDTGKPLTESVTDVPTEAVRYYNEVKERAAHAVEAGKSAAQKKQQEIDQRLQPKA